MLVGFSDFHWADAVIPNAELSANPAAHYVVEKLLIVEPQEKLSAFYGLQVICDFPIFSFVSLLLICCSSFQEMLVDHNFSSLGRLDEIFSIPVVFLLSLGYLAFLQ